MSRTLPRRLEGVNETRVVGHPQGIKRPCPLPQLAQEMLGFLNISATCLKTLPPKCHYAQHYANTDRLSCSSAVTWMWRRMGGGLSGDRPSWKWNGGREVQLSACWGERQAQVGPHREGTQERQGHFLWQERGAQRNPLSALLSLWVSLLRIQQCLNRKDSHLWLHGVLLPPHRTGDSPSNNPQARDTFGILLAASSFSTSSFPRWNLKTQGVTSASPRWQLHLIHHLHNTLSCFICRAHKKAISWARTWKSLLVTSKNSTEVLNTPTALGSAWFHVHPAKATAKPVSPPCCVRTARLWTLL